LNFEKDFQREDTKSWLTTLRRGPAKYSQLRSGNQRTLDMNINRNPVQAADAVVIAEMRAANAENKRKVIGPEARSDSHAIHSAEPPTLLVRADEVIE
jgi:hypothetical protein